jgi:Vitamin B12 dependent methionine synthase, activation domain
MGIRAGRKVIPGRSNRRKISRHPDGCRLSGYPDHAEKRTLFDLLDAENNARVTLTESFEMHPGSSVSGLYFSQPEAKYFGVGQIGRDQVVDYATRRGESHRASNRVRIVSHNKSMK